MVTCKIIHDSAISDQVIVCGVEEAFLNKVKVFGYEFSFKPKLLSPLFTVITPLLIASGLTLTN